MATDFPCAQCREISARFERYRQDSWAWDNVLGDLRRHWLVKHKDVPEIVRADYLHKVKYG